jgi:hypothetical protein
MARLARPPAPVTCPGCGWVSVDAPHYCQKCGHDFWRSAAGEAQRTLRALPPPPARADRRVTAALVTAGIAGLIVAAIATVAFVIGASEEERPQIVNTRPTPRPGQAIIEAFYREARNPAASYTYRSEGTIRVSDPQSESSFVEVVTMRGPDWLAELTVTSDGESTTTGLAEVGGEYFERTDDEWAGINARQNGPDGPFARITTVADVEYVGRELSGDVALHHLVVTKWLGDSGSDWRLSGFGRLTGREGRLDVWVTDDGVPVRATQSMTHTLTDQLGSYVVTVEESLTFEAWGDAAPIEPPVEA